MNENGTQTSSDEIPTFAHRKRWPFREEFRGQRRGDLAMTKLGHSRRGVLYVVNALLDAGGESRLAEDRHQVRRPECLDLGLGSLERCNGFPERILERKRLDHDGSFSDAREELLLNEGV